MGTTVKAGVKMIIPAGMKQAVCFDYWDIGRQKSEYQGKININPQVIIGWELEDVITAGEYVGKRFTISKFYNLYLGEKSNLRKDLTAWRGKDFDAKELEGFDLDNLIGMNCLLNIGHNKDGTRNKILGIAPLTKTMQKMIPENKRATPEWVQKFIDKQVKDGDVPEVAEEIHDEEAPF